MNIAIIRASRRYLPALLRVWCLGCVLIWVLPIQAEIIDYIYQDGLNVAASYSGTIDLTDLVSAGYSPQSAVIDPVGPLQVFNSGTLEVYLGIEGPMTFGTSPPVYADSSTGDPFGFQGPGMIYLPDGYTSGSFISGSETFDSTTLSGMGLIDGTYTYFWGTGTDADSIVVEIGTTPPATVPEPASLGLLSLLAVSLVIVSRRRASTEPRL